MRVVFHQVGPYQDLVSQSDVSSGLSLIKFNMDSLYVAHARKLYKINVCYTLIFVFYIYI